MSRASYQRRVEPSSRVYRQRRLAALSLLILTGALVVWLVSSAAGRGVPEASPVRLSIPAIGVDSEVTPVGATDRVLEVPPEPWVVGWWSGGARPGEGKGTVVLDVHRDSLEHGNGPFTRANELRAGDAASLEDESGLTHSYEVQDVQTFVKEALPYAALFRQDGPEQVVLVTCGGSYDPTAGWDSNVVVILNPAISDTSAVA